MDLRSGMPYWFLHHGLKTIAPPLLRDRTCDVVVVGSGITGALVAWTMASEGLEVIVLDARDVAQGSTVASTALLQYDLDVPLHRLATQVGWQRACRGFRIGVEAIERLIAIGRAVGVPVTITPSLYLARTADAESSLRQEFEARQRADLRVEWADESRLQREWGVHALAAIVSTAAAVVDPYALTHALHTDAMRQGVRLHDRTKVLDVERRGKGVEVLTDRDVSIRARAVVHATGYEAASLLPEGKVDLDSTYAIISEPISASEVPEAQLACLWWELADPYLYGRWAGDRLIVGGEDEPFVNPAARDQLLAEKASTLHQKGGEVLRGITFETAFAWTGTFGSTKDGMGYIDALPGKPHEHVALGFGGNGITCSAIAAKILTDAVMERPNADAALYRLDR